MLLALLAVTAVLGSSRLRGFCVARSRPGHRPGRHRPGHRPAAAHLRPAAAGRRHRRRRRRRRPSSPSARRCGSPRTCAARPATSSRSASRGWASEDWKRSWKPWLRGTAFGFPFGALPAGGAEIPTFLSYVTEKRLSKHPEEFGKGAIEGVAGPEAANNASAAGTLVPMLSLGLPTNATAAVMLAAFTQLRHPARSAAVRERAAAGVGADRQPVHRQRAAAAAQPAAGPGLGQAAADPAALPVRRDPVLRHASAPTR